MRFLPGIAAALVAALAIAWTIRGRDGADAPRPPDSFLDAEVTLGDAAATGSCYTLRVVLTQRQFWLSSATSTWQERAPGEWSFRVEWLESDSVGAASLWREFDFAERGGLVEPVAIRGPAQANESDTAVAEIDIEAEFAEWIAVPRQRGTPKLAHCRKRAGNAADS